jgi:alkylation response protein AidB-like acyl-CoA dehydrogenase
MDFTLSEEQQAVADLARQIFEDRVDHQTLKQVEAGTDWFDRETWSTIAEAGLVGIAIAEEHGGGGMTLVELGQVLEAQGRSVVPLPLLPSSTAALAIGQFGSADQQARILPGVAAGTTVLTVGLQEHLDDDLEHPRTTAAPSGDGYTLDGQKIVVEYAALADRILVTATTPAGVGLFLVDPQAAGVTLAEGHSTRKQPMFEVTLAGVTVPADDVVGTPGQVDVTWVLERATALLCATQVGVVDKALRMSADYTTTREQFGRPIATFQAVTQRLADAYINAQCIRVSAYQAVWRLSVGLEATEAVRVAKFWASEPAQQIAHATQHVHGGIGIDIDYPLHRYTLWNKHIEHTLGASTQQLRAYGALLAS